MKSYTILVLLLLAVIFLSLSACAPGPADREPLNSEAETNWNVVTDVGEDTVDTPVFEESPGASESTVPDELPVFVEVTDQPESVDGIFEIPELWPDEIPVPEGLDVTHLTVGPGDRFNATLQGRGSLEELDNQYGGEIPGWIERDPWPLQYMVAQPFEASWYREDDTFDIVASGAGDGSLVRMLVTYNNRTPPGRMPEGWPSYLSLMPDMELSFGFIDQLGGVGLVLTGPVEPEVVADYYVTSLDGWTVVSPEGVPIINMGKLSLNFERDEEKLTVTVTPFDDYYVLTLIWYEWGY